MVPCFDTAQEAWEGLDGGLGKGWGADWETELHTPSPCYFFLNQDFFFQPHIGYAVKKTLRHRIQSFGPLLPLGPTRSSCDISEGRPNISTHKCALAHFGLHSNCLHHSAPCCVSMSLTYTAALAPALS